MNLRAIVIRIAAIAGACALLAPGYALAVDADAAQTLARQNNCFRCHAIDKKKMGPAWNDVAAKYKSDKDAEAKLVAHLTGNGPDKDHPVIKAKSPDDTKNLVDWILTLK